MKTARKQDFSPQFRRSLKTKDRKLADRRLNDLRAKIGCLKISPDAKLNFEQAANLWLETNKHALSSNTVHQIEARPISGCKKPWREPGAGNSDAKATANISPRMKPLRRIQVK